MSRFQRVFLPIVLRTKLTVSNTAILPYCNKSASYACNEFHSCMSSEPTSAWFLVRRNLTTMYSSWGKTNQSTISWTNLACREFADICWQAPQFIYWIPFCHAHWSPEIPSIFVQCLCNDNATHIFFHVGVTYFNNNDTHVSKWRSVWTWKHWDHEK